MWALQQQQPPLCAVLLSCKGRPPPGAGRDRCCSWRRRGVMNDCSDVSAGMAALSHRARAVPRLSPRGARAPQPGLPLSPAAETQLKLAGTWVTGFSETHIFVEYMRSDWVWMLLFSQALVQELSHLLNVLVVKPVLCIGREAWMLLQSHKSAENWVARI